MPTPSRPRYPNPQSDPNRINLWDREQNGFELNVPANGQYRLHVNKPKQYQVIQVAAPVDTTGTLTFSIDGRTGDNNVIDLASEETIRILRPNFRTIYFDVDVEGVPDDVFLVVHVVPEG